MTERPNVVLIMMDDMGYGDLSCTGSSLIRTPNMDAIATGGMTFTDAYAGAPTCTPSRAALMTGRYAQRVGLPRVIFPDDAEGLPGSEVTVAEVLRDAGYRCAAYGKWHLGAKPEHHPVEHGFEEFVGLPYSNDMDPVYLMAGTERLDGEVDQSLLTRRYTDEAMAFIERHREEPFFVYLPHTMPHIPLHVEEEFRGTSAAGTYGDVIECIDHHVGRLTAHLDRLGLTDDTLVIITSDNGPWFEGSAGGFRGRKIQTWEGGVRVPFLARWPRRIAAGSRCAEPISFLDLLPTLAGLGGGRVPDDRPLDGVDVGALLDGGPAPEREALYFFSHWSLNAVRSGRWKLHVARHPERDRRELPQLFDLVADPGESYDLGSLHPHEVQRLLGLARGFADEIEAQRPDAQRRAGTDLLKEASRTDLVTDRTFQEG